MTQNNERPLPRSTFDEWWFSKYCPFKLAHTHREVAVGAWIARDAQVAELEAALVLAREALERVAEQAFNPNKCRHRRSGFAGSPCDITCQACAVENAKVVLSTINTVLEKENLQPKSQDTSSIT